MNNRIIYVDNTYNISLIEILEDKDNINDYFEYENDISKLNYKELICIYNIRKNINERIVYGSLKAREDEKDKKNFYYLSQNSNIEPFSPILNILNNKIIGFHEKLNNANNIGVFINTFLENFTLQKVFNKNSSGLGKFLIKRLLRELKSAEGSNNYKIKYRPDNFSIWDVIIFGHENTPYQNGKFSLEIYINKDYPFKPPMIFFKSKIYHPNFKGDNSKICCCSIKEFSLEYWSPKLTIPIILDKIYSLLKSPDIDKNISCVNCNLECATTMKENPEKYKEIATKWTKEFAV